MRARRVRVDGTTMPQSDSARMSNAIAVTPLLRSLSFCLADRTARATAPIEPLTPVATAPHWQVDARRAFYSPIKAWRDAIENSALHILPGIIVHDSILQQRCICTGRDPRKCRAPGFNAAGQYRVLCAVCVRDTDVTRQLRSSIEPQAPRPQQLINRVLRILRDT